MAYPSIAGYKDALQIPEASFRNLAYLKPVHAAGGDFYFSSGAFSVVFKMLDTRNGRLKAVKCFTRGQERREESLRQISAYLGLHPSPYVLPYMYMEQELWAEGGDHPVLLMEWVEGETLGQHLQRLCTSSNKAGIRDLCRRFAALGSWLIRQEWAHGDLKPDNILVRPDGALLLVDYDGSFVPGMEGQQARELGSPGFQHPNRTSAFFNRHMDDFSILVLFSSLLPLLYFPELFSYTFDGEQLVFSPAKLQKPDEQVSVCSIFRKYNPFLDRALLLLEKAMQQPPGPIPGLQTLLSDFLQARNIAPVPKVEVRFPKQPQPPPQPKRWQQAKQEEKTKSQVTDTLAIIIACSLTLIVTNFFNSTPKQTYVPYLSEYAFPPPPPPPPPPYSSISTKYLDDYLQNADLFKNYGKMPLYPEKISWPAAVTDSLLLGAPQDSATLMPSGALQEIAQTPKIAPKADPSVPDSAAREENTEFLQYLNARNANTVITWRLFLVNHPNSPLEASARQALSDLQAQFSILVAFAELLNKQGDTAGAREYLLKAERMDPGNPLVRERMKALDQ